MHDTETARPVQANRWIAALLSLVVPGLGQLYLGRRVMALVLHLGWLGIIAVWVFWAMGSFRATLATAGVAVAWLLVGAAHSAALGRQQPLQPNCPWYGRWPALLGLLLLGNGLTELSLLRLLPSRYHLLTMSAASMVPTLLPGEVVVGDLRAFQDHLPARRDLVLIASPEDTQAIWALRCVGIPGDLVEVRDRQLLVNGEPQVGAHLPWKPSVGRLDDPYHLDQAGPVLLQERQLFCLGDNWDNSVDSRYFGPMPVTALRGKPLYRLVPGHRSRLGQPLG
jgi:signal peptidase I